MGIKYDSWVLSDSLGIKYIYMKTFLILISDATFTAYSLTADESSDPPFTTILNWQIFSFEAYGVCFIQFRFKIKI